MSDLGKRILDGLKDAVDGNFARVTIEGQTWARQPEWQPIESAPKDKDVIVTNGTAVGEARFFEDADGWWWAGSCPTDYQDNKVHQPTHWMPLPEAPR